MSSGPSLYLFSRVIIRHRYEEKKGGAGDGRNVFPTDTDVIPPFTVVEIMLTPANQGGFEQGYGLQVCLYKSLV